MFIFYTLGKFIIFKIRFLIFCLILSIKKMTIKVKKNELFILYFIGDPMRSFYFLFVFSYLLKKRTADFWAFSIFSDTLFSTSDEDIHLLPNTV